MGIEKKLEQMGIRSNVGLASLLCSNNPKIISEAWDTGVGFIVLKTMMDAEANPEKQLAKRIISTDDNTTFYHTGTTDKEQYNFQADADKIIRLVNGLYANNIIAIPSIGTKKTCIEAWENMECILARTEARIFELNLRYLYRGLLAKFMQGTPLNEYLDNGIKEISGRDRNRAQYLANEEFENLLNRIREVFPPEKYCLIAKLWPCDEIMLHLMYAAESRFDAVTLVNSVKKEAPESSEFVGSKIPQMSGIELRRYRNYTLELAKRMNYSMPIFASGGVAIEAIRDVEFNGAEHIPKEMLSRKNFQDAVFDIRRCFEFGASYVQLGSVGYFRGPNGNVFETIGKLVRGGGYKPLDTNPKIQAALNQNL